MKLLDESGFQQGDNIITNRRGIFEYYQDRQFLSRDKLGNSGRSDIMYGRNGEPVSDNVEGVYNMGADMNDITSIIINEKNGWIVVDIFRNRRADTKGFPLHSYKLLGKNIDYLGLVDKFDIYRWY